MSAGLFIAKRADGRAYWRVVFDRVVGMMPGDVVEHGELLELLETSDRRLLYRSVARADRQLRQTKQRAMSVVPGKGYRMLRADEHQARAEGHKVRAGRQLSTAVSVMRATDLATLEPAARDWAMRVTTGMVMLAQAVGAQAAILARHEDLITDLNQRVAGLEKHGDNAIA